MIEARVRSALTPEPDERREVVSAFFTAHPGGGAGPLGLGRAVADFVDWEIRSGRITDGGGGSPWWRLVNGGMILDLRDAATVLAGEGIDGARGPVCDGGAVAAWIAYASEGGTSGGAPAQARLWVAHQASLHAALVAADGAALLAEERPAERAFAGLVVDVVDATAEHGRPTDTDELCRMTARHYPKEYPITPAEWDALHERFAPLLSNG